MLRTWAGRSRSSPDSLAQDGRGDTVTSNVLGLVVREATTNILRHSHASSARISLRLISSTARDDDAVPAGRASRRRRLPGGGAYLELVIHNDGASPSSDSTPDDSAGNGLAGLRDRLSALGGTLTDTFDPAHDGFTLTARVPLTGGDHE